MNNPIDDEWRGYTEAKIKELERRVTVVETHPFVCPQIKLSTDHEERLRRLESMRWQLAGIIALAQALGVGVILAAVKEWMR